MTADELKIQLEAVRDAFRNYSLAREECARFREMLLGAPRISGMPHSDSHENSTENKLIRIATYDEETEKYFRKYLDARKNAEKIINILSTCVEREVLIRRYIMLYGWSDIADQMHFSQAHIRRLHSAALENICAKMCGNVSE